MSTKDLEMIPMPEGKKKNIEYEIKKLEEEAKEKKEVIKKNNEPMEKPVGAGLVGSNVTKQLEDMKKISSLAKSAKLPNITEIMPTSPEDKLEKAKDNIEKEVWNIAQDPEKMKFASDMVNDLTEWTKSGFNWQRIKSSNETADSYLKYVRTVGKYKNKAEKFVIGFVPIAGGAMDIIEGVTGREYDADINDPPMTATQRFTSIAMGVGSIALDVCTGGVSSVAKGGGKVALEVGEGVVKTAVKEGAEAGVKMAVKEGTEAAVEGAVKAGTTALVEEGVESVGKSIFKESSEVISKNVMENGAELLAKKGGKTGQKLAESMKKVNDFLDKNPQLRKYFDDYLTTVQKNKKSMGDLEKLEVTDIIDAIEVLPVKVGGKGKGEEGGVEAATEQPEAPAQSIEPSEASQAFSAELAKGAEKYGDMMDETVDNKPLTREELLEKMNSDMVKAKERIDKEKNLSPELEQATGEKLDKKIEEAGFDPKTNKPAEAAEEAIAKNPKLENKNKESLRRFGNTVDKIYNDKDWYKKLTTKPVDFIMDIFDKDNGLRLEDFTNVGAMADNFLKEGKEATMAGVDEKYGLPRLLAMRDNIKGYMGYKLVNTAIDAMPNVEPFKGVIKNLAATLMSMKGGVDFTQKPPKSLEKGWNPLRNMYIDAKFFAGRIPYIFGGLDIDETLGWLTENKDKIQKPTLGQMDMFGDLPKEDTKVQTQTETAEIVEEEGKIKDIEGQMDMFGDLVEEDKEEIPVPENITPTQPEEVEDEEEEVDENKPDMLGSFH